MNTKRKDNFSNEYNQRTQAIKIFTDRKELQEAFERKLCALNEDWQKKPYVLYYYGSDEMGKKDFVNKLCSVIQNLEENEHLLPSPPYCNYIHYDFTTVGTDKLTMLLRWRELLQSINSNFRFIRFDTAIESYGKKIGKNFQQVRMNQPASKKYEFDIVSDCFLQNKNL